MPPQSRASQIKDTLSVIEKLRPAEAPRVFARADRSVKVIREALSSAWVDAEHELRITEALAAEAGLEAVREASVGAMEVMMASPLLKAMWDGAVKLFGLKAAAILRWAPQFWGQLYRDCGTLSHDAAARTLTCDGLPEMFAASEAWRVGMCGALEGVLRLCGEQGQVTARRESSMRVVFMLP